jgi:hypothetical protein
MLKEEIGESLLRVKAAKFGHALDEIAPPFTNAFYLPDKKQFEPVVILESEGRHRRAKTLDSSAQSYMKTRVGVRKDSIKKSSV